LDKRYFDPELPVRRSNRLQFYDYSSDGAYFVTICQYDRHQPVLKQPAISKILEETWYGLPQRFSSVALDHLILMPDHVHFILWLRPDKESQPPLGNVVGAYKSITARAALQYLRTQGQISGNHLWQRDYYEHVIRNEEDLNQTREYILNNPLKALELQLQRHEEKMRSRHR
jgi:putative transposase